MSGERAEHLATIESYLAERELDTRLAPVIADLHVSSGYSTDYLVEAVAAAFQWARASK